MKKIKSLIIKIYRLFVKPKSSLKDFEVEESIEEQISNKERQNLRKGQEGWSGLN